MAGWLLGAVLAYLAIQLLYVGEQARAGLLSGELGPGDILVGTLNVHALSFVAWLTLASLAGIGVWRGLAALSRSLEAERRRATELARMTEISAALQASREQQLSQVQTLHRLHQLISSSLNTPQVLGEIARAAVELTHAYVASFWIVDEEARTLEIAAFSDATIGASQDFRQARFGEAAAGWVAEHRESLVIDDVFADGRSRGLDWWRQHGLRSSCTLPVMLGERLLAVLSLNSRAPFRFGPGDW
jgi:hypothetical protein